MSKGMKELEKAVIGNLPWYWKLRYYALKPIYRAWWKLEKIWLRFK